MKIPRAESHASHLCIYSFNRHQSHIMSPSLDSAELEWLDQYAALRRTLAELKIEQPNGEIKGYGHDLVPDEEDLTSGSSLDDLWNVFSDDELDGVYSSDVFDGNSDLPDGGTKSTHTYGRGWLRSKCLALASKESSMGAGELQQQVSAMLASDIKGLHVRILSCSETD